MMVSMPSAGACGSAASAVPAICAERAWPHRGLPPPGHEPRLGETSWNGTRRSLVAATIFWLCGLGHLSGAQVVSADRFAAVKRYWEWSSYWGIDGLDFPLAGYRPGKSFRALIFFSEEILLGDPYWGFCSRDLGVCQAYSAWPDHSVYDARATRMKPSETEESALKRFRKQEFRSDEEAKAIALIGPRVPRLLLEPPEGQGTKAGPITPDSATSPYENRVRTVAATITLPDLGVPEVIRRRSANRFVENEILAQGRANAP